MTNVGFHSLASGQRRCLAHAAAWLQEKSAGYQLFPWGSAAETAVMLMMPRAVTEGVRIWAGLAAPIRIGPTGRVSAMTIVIVYAILGASRLGIMRTFASPFRREDGNTRSRIACDKAVLACISPSAPRSGTRWRRISSASRILRAEGVSSEPKSECDTRAIFGSIPNRRTWAAHSSVISAISGAVGSRRTWVSAIKKAPLLVIIKHIAERSVAPGTSPIMSLM